MRDRTQYFVNGGALPFALRELRGFMRNRVTLVGLVGAALILGISGPFGTIDQMRLLPRLAYWSVIVFCTFALGTFVGAFVEKLLDRYPPLLQFAASSLAIGLVVTGFLFLLNSAIFQGFYTDPADLAETAIYVILIAFVVNGGIAFGTSSFVDKAAAVPDDAPPALLSRLPNDKRGKLIAISATDHYVDVRTTQGNALILLRLADAIAEAGETGLQVHRSHWVAVDQVQQVTRKGDRAILTMSDASQIPVSRSFLPAARAAGVIKDTP